MLPFAPVIEFVIYMVFPLNSSVNMLTKTFAQSLHQAAALAQ